jgi:hypothetical protein
MVGIGVGKRQLSCVNPYKRSEPACPLDPSWQLCGRLAHRVVPIAVRREQTSRRCVDKGGRGRDAQTIVLALGMPERQQEFATINWGVTGGSCMIHGNRECGAPVRLTREITMIRHTELALAATFFAAFISIAPVNTAVALQHDYAVAFAARAQVHAPQMRPCIPQYDSAGVQRPPYCHRW